MNKIKIGVYKSNRKKSNNIVKNELVKAHAEYGYSPVEISETDFDSDIKCLFIIGGDGTILNFAKHLSKYSIPVIGINGGRLGFLAEFENNEVLEAVKLFHDNLLKKDARTLLRVSCNNKSTVAINDVLVERVYKDVPEAFVLTLQVTINDTVIDTVKGDGIIVSTPTGSTAYSLSAGGSIIDPKAEAFSITPICAHSMHNRPIVVSSASKIGITCIDNSACGVFADGKYISAISGSRKVVIKKAKKKIIFLRRADSDFYKKLKQKFGKEYL